MLKKSLDNPRAAPYATPSMSSPLSPTMLIRGSFVHAWTERGDHLNGRDEEGDQEGGSEDEEEEVRRRSSGFAGGEKSPPYAFWGARVIAVSTACAANTVGSVSGRAALLHSAHVFIEDGAWGPTHAISNNEGIRALLAASAVARSPSPLGRGEATNKATTSSPAMSLRVSFKFPRARTARSPPPHRLRRSSGGLRDRARGARGPRCP